MLCWSGPTPSRLLGLEKMKLTSRLYYGEINSSNAVTYRPICPIVMEEVDCPPHPHHRRYEAAGGRRGSCGVCVGRFHLARGSLQPWTLVVLKAVVARWKSLSLVTKIAFLAWARGAADEEAKGQINIIKKAARGPITTAISRELDSLRRDSLVRQDQLRNLYRATLLMGALYECQPAVIDRRYKGMRKTSCRCI